MKDFDISQEALSGWSAAGNHHPMALFETIAQGAQGASPEDRRLLPDRLCRAVLEVLPVDGAALSVYLGADVTVPIGASDPDAARGEALQFTLREGPCLASYTSRRPVAIPDIDQPRSRARSLWPLYTCELSRHTPYRAVFAYPLLLRGAAVGSLGVYGRGPGSMAAEGDLSAIAALITGSLLQAETLAGLGGEQEHPWIDAPATRARRQVWLAQGLTMKANRVTAAEALDLLRAQAYTAGRLLDDVAGDIVAGRLPIPVLGPRH
jgi:hypothetical protein